MYAQTASGGVLLDYAVSTDPAPLVASSSAAGASPAVGTVTLVASNGSTETVCYLQSLRVSLQVGPYAQDLTADGAAIVATVLNGSGGPWAEPTVVSTAGPYVIEIESESGQPVAMTADALVVELSGIAMNAEPGVALLTVTELASSTSPSFVTGDYHTNTWTQPIGKFPYGFYMTDFAPSVPLVQNGGAVTLTWDASEDAVYTLTYGANCINVTDVRRYTASGLTVDTTFLLCGTASGVSTYLSTTVTVAEPDLSATTLTVLGGSTLGGDVTMRSDLDVAGATELTDLNVVGTAALSEVSITSNLTIEGGGVSMLQHPAQIISFNLVNSQTFHDTCETDSFLVGLLGPNVTSPPANISISVPNEYGVDIQFFPTAPFTLPICAGTELTVQFDSSLGFSGMNIYLYQLGQEVQYGTGSWSYPDMITQKPSRSPEIPNRNVDDRSAAAPDAADRQTEAREAAVGAAADAILRCIADGASPERRTALEDALGALLRPSRKA